MKKTSAVIICLTCAVGIAQPIAVQRLRGNNTSIVGQRLQLMNPAQLPNYSRSAIPEQLGGIAYQPLPGALGYRTNRLVGANTTATPKASQGQSGFVASVSDGQVTHVLYVPPLIQGSVITFTNQNNMRVVMSGSWSITYNHQ